MQWSVQKVICDKAAGRPTKGIKDVQDSVHHTPVCRGTCLLAVQVGIQDHVVEAADKHEPKEPMGVKGKGAWFKEQVWQQPNDIHCSAHQVPLPLVQEQLLLV
eukprot:2556190-Amphidinium_carterae.1